MRYILIAIAIYFAYQFIFKLAIPVYKASQKIKKGFSEMQDRMQEQMNQQQQKTTSNPSAAKEPKVSKGDYIDFEEVKDM